MFNRGFLKAIQGRIQRGYLGRCLRDRSGAAAILIALLLVPICGGLGLAIDASLAFMVESRLSKSLDAAALAAGRIADSDDAEDVASAYFDANFANASAFVNMSQVTYEYDPESRTVTMDARATIPTYFARVIGVDSLSVTAHTVVERRTSGLELALVMDITGSMRRQNRFTGMHAASLKLVEAIYGDETEIENLYISIVPYVAAVNPGPAYTDWLEVGDLALITPDEWSDDPDGWRGCVEARDYPYDTDDTPPSEEKFTSYLYQSTDTDTNDNKYPPYKDDVIYDANGRGPNLGCGTPITPLTKSRTTIESGLNAMQAWANRNGTTGNLGLSWGWRTISPRWRGLWRGETPSRYPLDYGEPLMEKAVVILTDGKNQFADISKKAGSPKSDYTAYRRIEDGLGTTSLNQGRRILDQRMAETCEAMKAKGITLYAITFGVEVDPDSRSLFGACATAPSMYYHAPSNDELTGVFQEIAGQLASLRITE